MKCILLKASLATLFLVNCSYSFSQQTTATATATTPTQEVIKEPASLIPVVKLSDNVTVKFGGFVRAEYYIDSKKTVGAVDDLFGFFPENEMKDADGKDINNTVRQNISAQATRFNALFAGPDALGAKSTAYFEFDFSGGAATTGTTTNPVGLRLRHAYLKLAWTKSEVLVGKTWNPLGETIFPSVLALHVGIPFRPFGRGDQLRFTFKPTSSINILAACLYQTEHKSFTYTNVDVTSPTGTTVANTNDIKINTLPDFHLQVHYKRGPIFTGLVSEYKIIRPALTTKGKNGTYLAKETVSSYAAGAFLRFTKGKLTIQGSGIYGQNLSELFQQGGYAVTGIDTATGSRKYTPSNSISGWVNITYGEKFMVGLFGGYQKNLGFNKNILKGTGTFLGRWQDIDHVYRVTPTLKYTVGRFVLSGEVDYNIVGYGTVDYSNKGKVKDVKERNAVRGLVAATFLF